MFRLQGWKGNVKARHFILALRDYFQEKIDLEKKAHEQSEKEPTMTDKWAFKYIHISYLQPILEAIDDDSSGFIRISEVNSFTKSRPEDWRYVQLTWVQNFSADQYKIKFAAMDRFLGSGLVLLRIHNIY